MVVTCYPILFSLRKTTDARCSLSLKHALDSPERQQIRGNSKQAHLVHQFLQIPRAWRVAEISEESGTIPASNSLLLLFVRKSGCVKVDGLARLGQSYR